MTHASALVAVALALAGRPSPEKGLEVTVEIDPCLSVAKSEVLRVTELELDARVVSPSLAPPHATRVDVSCAGRYVRLRVTDPVPGAAPALLIIGGAGGVGSIAIQIARALTDLTIVATASRPETQDWVKELGAHHVVDHSQPIAPQVDREESR